MYKTKSYTSSWLYRWILLCTAPSLALTLTLPATGTMGTPNSALLQRYPPKPIQPPSSNPRADNSHSPPLSYPPQAFQTRAHYIPDRPAMNIPSIFLNLLNIAYLNAPYGFRKTWQGMQEPEALPGYHVSVIFGPSTQDPTATMSNRFVMWGLWEAAIAIYRDRIFTPCVVTFYWHKDPVGGLILQTGDQTLLVAAKDDANPGEEDTITPTNLTTAAPITEAPSSSLQAPDLRILYEFGTHTLSSLDLFLAAFPVFSLVAEKGVDFQCEALSQHGYDTPHRVGFAITAVKDAQGNVKLKYGHVREAVKETVFGAVERKMWRNMRFRVVLDGEVIARGEWGSG
ncbi:MAG: hypothetical protein Q9207_007113 [Kuettlingeria erythrocarpa]